MNLICLSNQILSAVVHSRRMLVLITFCLQLSCAWAEDQHRYILTPLGTLGGTFSRAEAINNLGWVVGESETDTGELRAFLWTMEDGMRDLGTLGGVNSRALAINNRGMVAGESATSDGRTLAFYWTSDGGMRPAATTTQTLFSTAFALNDNNRMVGSLEEPKASHAVIWHDNRMTYVPRLPGPGYIQPLDLNLEGDIVGHIQTGTGETLASHAFYIRRGVYAQNLADFKLISPQSGSAAVAINKRGDAAGYIMQESSRVRAFLYTRSAGVQILDDRDALYSSASDINDRGQVVGSCIPSYASDEAACVWIEHQPINLNEVTAKDDAWWLIHATGINEAGVITGYGLLGEQNQAFILRPASGPN